MALPTAYARVALNFVDSDNKPWQNVFYYEIGGTFPSNWDVQAAAVALQGHFATQLLNVLSSDVIFLGIDLRVNNGGLSSDASTYPNTPGSAAAGSVPNEVAAIVHWQTSQPGKSGRGRSYITGFQNSDVNGGRVNTTLNGLIGLLAAALLTSFTNQGVSYGLRLLSKKLTTMFPISSFVVETLLGTQRRRRPRR